VGQALAGLGIARSAELEKNRIAWVAADEDVKAGGSQSDA
jgi:hypothetical protein